MDATELLGQWASAASIVHQSPTPLRSVGDRERVFPWASVSKLAVAALVGYHVQRGDLRLDEPLGPEGSTLAHVLSHSSGVGPTRGALGSRVGVKRIYSTYGYEIVVERLGGVDKFAESCRSTLGLTSTVSDGTLAGGLNGTLADLELLAQTWMGHGPVEPDTLRLMTSVFLPDLSGVVPGFGSFQPCPWALGPQVKGGNSHWMGANWPPHALGHFGQSGSLVLIDAERDLAVVALASRDFGPWAVAMWPEWTSHVYELLQ